MAQIQGQAGDLCSSPGQLPCFPGQVVWETDKATQLPCPPTSLWAGGQPVPSKLLTSLLLSTRAPAFLSSSFTNIRG